MIIEGAGHFTPLEQPWIVTKALERQLATDSRSPKPGARRESQITIQRRIGPQLSLAQSIRGYKQDNFEVAFRGLRSTPKT